MQPELLRFFSNWNEWKAYDGEMRLKRICMVFFPEFCPSILIISYFNSLLGESHNRSVYAWIYKYKCNAVYLQNSECEVKKTRRS